MVRLSTIVFLIALWVPPAWAGPGHDHGAGHDAAPTTMVVPRLESVGTELELVAVVVDHQLMLYLDESATNEPVDGAVIEVSGDTIETSTATQSAPGTYTLTSEWLDGTGTKALTFVVTAGDRIELLNGTLELGHAEAGASGSAESAALLSEPLLWIVAGIAAFVGFFLASAFRPATPPDSADEEPAKQAPPRLDVVGSSKRSAAIMLAAAALTGAMIADATAGPGHDHGEGGHDATADAGGYVPRRLPDGDVFLPKPSQRLLSVRTAVAEAKKTQTSEELIGTVIADPASEGRVQAPVDGSVELAKDGVAFVGERVKAGDVLAYLAPSMPVYERGYLEQLTAEVDGKMRIAEQRLKRLQGVRDNYIAQKDIDDTQVELSALQEQKRVLEPKGQRIALTAPVDGIISVANVRAGQVVDARDTLFEIVDPDRLWIEAIGASGRNYDDLDAAHAALDEGRSVPIRFVGSAPALRHQARPLFFEVSRSDASLAIGTRVHVVLQTGSPVNGIVVPETAIVRANNGLNRIWVKIGAEQFQPQDVRTEPLGNGDVLVTAGLETGSRVVVSGSELINQVR